MAVDQLIESYVPYRVKPIIAHAYVGPFLSLYMVWGYIWLFVYGYNEHWELGCIIMAGIGFSQILTMLFCHWFVNVNCLLTCSHEPNIEKATAVKVIPTPNNGWTELVSLQRMTMMDGKKKLWFEFQKVHYTFVWERKSFVALELDTNQPMSYFQESRGLETDEAVIEKRQKLGDNRMEMVIPFFMELFKERATAPFFVFQVFCVGLWCLEDMWYYSLFTLMMLMTFEATLVRQQLKNMSEIRNMGNKPYLIYTYRSRRWNRIKSDELLPGDIVSISRSLEEKTVPCDLLLLRGPCIVDESMLTGESVPQMKEPIQDIEKSRYFDFELDSRLHVVFGGTKVVQHTSPAKNESGMKAPDGGCICYVLRTGFNTCQGKLLRTIMFGVKRVTANNIETFAFILFLLIFAIAAASYLWIKGSEDESRSKYKLFLECSLILTSVVPPELPIELSLAVNNSLMALQKLGVFCTEPFRIPFAGKVDICCFDKTGTLTADNLIVEGIASAIIYPGNECQIHHLPSLSPPESIQVLVTCHSLVRFDEDLVGDPLEKACLNWAEWNLTKNDTVIPRKGKMQPLKIFHRYHFSSALKRMTVIAGYIAAGKNETKHIVTVKGAPEILESMYRAVPDNYIQTYRQLSRQGARVLALGIREVGTLSYQEIRDRKREDFERNLTFAGFVVISCPLKPDTKAVVKEIVESSHRVAMITGDNPLAACHVAKVLRFTRKSAPIFILDEPQGNDKWTWKSVNDDSEKDLLPSSSTERVAFISNYEFCITGRAFMHLLNKHIHFLRYIIPHVKIFARMAPKEKERVINELKGLGFVTLMCGDGTNDVGALKHADVGVALLSHPFDATKAGRKKKDKENSGSADALSNHPNQQHTDLHTNLSSSLKNLKKSFGQHIGRRTDAPCGAKHCRHNTGSVTVTERFEQMIKDLEEEEKVQVVRLGDASVAAPFTSKYTSLQSVCHVIKQGRCTLVTTLQMFKILALNALVLAYSQSVLYLDGIKFSDTQATVQGLLLAACFLFISRSRPLKTLARQRPVPNIFNAYTLLTVSLQFAIHFGCLIYIVREAQAAEPREKVDLEAEFRPNLLNSAVYLMALGLQIATFAVNYRGRPFMESLTENKSMLYSLLFSGCTVFALASGISPELTKKFELVELPLEYRKALLTCIAADLLACFVVDRILCFLLGDMRTSG